MVHKASRENPKKTNDLFYDDVSVNVLGGSGILVKMEWMYKTFIFNSFAFLSLKDTIEWVKEKRASKHYKIVVRDIENAREWATL